MILGHSVLDDLCLLVHLPLTQQELFVNEFLAVDDIGAAIFGNVSEGQRADANHWRQNFCIRVIDGTNGAFQAMTQLDGPHIVMCAFSLLFFVFV